MAWFEIELGLTMNSNEEWSEILPLLIWGISVLISSKNSLEESHGVISDLGTDEDSATEVEGEFKFVTFLEPDLTNVILLHFTLKELFAKTTSEINSLGKTVLLNNLGERTSEPHGGEEILDNLSMTLVLIRNPTHNNFSEGDDLVHIEVAQEVVVNEILIEDELNILFEVVMITEGTLHRY